MAGALVTVLLMVQLGVAVLRRGRVQQCDEPRVLYEEPVTAFVANVLGASNLIPAQVLMGKSSFNSGGSISAGLPDYTRNRIRAIAALLEQEP